MRAILLPSIIVTLTSVSCYKDDMKMIVDVVKSMNKPLFVVSALCWTPRENVELINKLNSHGFATINSHFKSGKDLEINILHQTLFIADIQCPGSQDLFVEAEKKHLFNRPFRWLILGGNTTSTSAVPDVLFHSKIRVDSDVVITYYDENQSIFLNSIFRSENDFKWQTEYYGLWQSEVGLKKSKEMSSEAANRRNGLVDTYIRISHVITDNDTYEHLTDYRNSHVDTITKLGFISAGLLMDFMKGKSEHIYTDGWGYFINNSWTGETGTLARGESDLGATAMFMMPERTYLLDFLVCPVATKIKFLFRQPPLSYEHNLYILAFRNSVWFSTVGLIVILMFTLFANALWEYKITNNQDFSSILKANFSDITIFILGAVCQQGSPVELKRSLGRVVMIVLFLISTFLYTSYSANIVVLRQSIASNIRTLKDLYNSKLELGVQDINYNRYYFSMASDPLRKSIYQKKVAPPGKPARFFSMEDGIKKMKNEPFAFHVELASGYKFVEKYFFESEKCGLTDIGFLSIQDPWISCPRNSPYREIFKLGCSCFIMFIKRAVVADKIITQAFTNELLRLQEHGINSRNVNMLYTKKPKCLSRGGNFESVSIIDSYPALLVLAYGLLAAFLILFTEILLHKIHSHKRRIHIVEFE